jgi:hypothetical protein
VTMRTCCLQVPNRPWGDKGAIACRAVFTCLREPPKRALATFVATSTAAPAVSPIRLCARGRRFSRPVGPTLPTRPQSSVRSRVTRDASAIRRSRDARRR